MITNLETRPCPRCAQERDVEVTRPPWREVLHLWCLHCGRCWLLFVADEVLGYRQASA